MASRQRGTTSEPMTIDGRMLIGREEAREEPYNTTFLPKLNARLAPR